MTYCIGCKDRLDFEDITWEDSGYCSEICHDAHELSYEEFMEKHVGRLNRLL